MDWNTKALLEEAGFIVKGNTVRSHPAYNGFCTEEVENLIMLVREESAKKIAELTAAIEHHQER